MWSVECGVLSVECRGLSVEGSRVGVQGSAHQNSVERESAGPLSSEDGTI